MGDKQQGSVAAPVLSFGSTTTRPWVSHEPLALSSVQPNRMAAPSWTASSGQTGTIVVATYPWQQLAVCKQEVLPNHEQAASQQSGEKSRQGSHSVYFDAPVATHTESKCDHHGVELLFFYREAERAWEHCRSSTPVSLKKLVKTSLALAKQTKRGGTKSKSQPNKTPKQRPRQVPEWGETCGTRVKG